MQPARIVVVGPGLMGMKHIAMVKEHPSAELVGIVQPDPVHSRELSGRFGLPVFGDIDTCLDVLQPDGVILSSPNCFHFAQATTCIQRDVAVLIEKPITASVAEAIALVSLVEERRVPVIVGHHRAHSSLVKAAKAVIEGRRLGRLVAFQGSAVFRKPDAYFAEAPWRALEGGGPILINLIHEVGLMRTLIGNIEAVQAMTSSRMRQHAVEDTAAVNLLFEGGCLGTFLLSDAGASARSWEQTTGENPAFFRSPGETCYTITGETGTLHFPSMRLESFVTREEASWMNAFHTEIYPVDIRDPLSAQLENFIGVIRGEENAVVTPREGLENLRVIEAIQQSAATGKVVAVSQ